MNLTEYIYNTTYTAVVDTFGFELKYLTKFYKIAISFVSAFSGKKTSTYYIIAKICNRSNIWCGTNRHGNMYGMHINTIN